MFRGELTKQQQEIPMQKIIDTIPAEQRYGYQLFTFEDHPQFLDTDEVWYPFSKTWSKIESPDCIPGAVFRRPLDLGNAAGAAPEFALRGWSEKASMEDECFIARIGKWTRLDDQGIMLVDLTVSNIVGNYPSIIAIRRRIADPARVPEVTPAAAEPPVQQQEPTPEQVAVTASQIYYAATASQASSPTWDKMKLDYPKSRECYFRIARWHLAHRAAPAVAPGLTFSDALRIALGCKDYGGGHRSDGHMEIYQHGIWTVINALERAQKNGLADTQVAALHSIGAADPESQPAAQQQTGMKWVLVKDGLPDEKDLGARYKVQWSDNGEESDEFFTLEGVIHRHKRASINAWCKVELPPAPPLPERACCDKWKQFEHGADVFRFCPGCGKPRIVAKEDSK